MENKSVKWFTAYAEKPAHEERGERAISHVVDFAFKTLDLILLIPGEIKNKFDKE